jgi:hypothetical protein
VLVGAQFAIVTPVLVVGGLLLSSLNELTHVNLGFERHNIVTGAMLLPASQYPAARAIAYWDELQRRVSSIPGITAVAYADGRPAEWQPGFQRFRARGFADAARTLAACRAVDFRVGRLFQTPRPDAARGPTAAPSDGGSSLAAAHNAPGPSSSAW